MCWFCLRSSDRLLAQSCSFTYFLSRTLFDRVIPWLILLAAVLLLFQPHRKGICNEKAARSLRRLRAPFSSSWSPLMAVTSGAGMGIMMLAAFALFMEGTIHELNAVKAWLGLVINFVASIIFLFEHIIDPTVAIVLTLGSIVGGFYAAKYSQKVRSPDKMRISIAIYGVLAAGYFFCEGIRLRKY